MRNWLKKFLGVTELENQISKLKSDLNALQEKSEQTIIQGDFNDIELHVLRILSNGSATTEEVALQLKKSRSYTSQLLNQLKKLKVVTSFKNGRTVYFDIALRKPLVPEKT